MRIAKTVESFPLSRVGTFDTGRIGRSKHHITGLLEIDVTTGRERLRRLRREGMAISFNAWFLKTIADAIAATPQVHGILHGRRRRVVFEDVDIAFMVERTVDGTAVPLPLVLRACNQKTAGEIDAEIDDAAAQPIDGAQDYELGRRRSAFLTRLYFSLPQFMRVAVFKAILANPEAHKKTMGTVMVTSIAPGLRFPGWIVPRSMHNLVFALGSIVRKPRVVGTQVIARDVLHLTIHLDHDVVDGGPAARFVSQLVKQLEAASALPPIAQ